MFQVITHSYRVSVNRLIQATLVFRINSDSQRNELIRKKTHTNHFDIQKLERHAHKKTCVRTRRSRDKASGVM